MIRRRLRLSCILVLVLLPLLLAMPPAITADPQAPIDPAVLASIKDAGKTAYWVVLRERADLTQASRMSREARGRFVVDQLRLVAGRTQAGLRAVLAARGADATPFWGANVLRVSSDLATLEMIAARPEVERIEADRLYRVPDPLPGVEEQTILGVEWNIANIRAPEAWSTFGARGEGIVVGSIDTGTQFDHPALVGQYRGNQGGGVFDHNYNWHDPSRICGNPSLAPCDNNNHGTHTMGTIVGDDGGANQIGVAPAARWITAKGCESSSCSATALLAAGQWMLAPTDLSGGNPRPDLRPDIVSNSWGGAPGDSWYQQIVQSWVAAGIFPVFANGNSGSACSTAGSPGDYPESYGVGAYDSSNVIAYFSSRGASRFGNIIKPNISAPGVNVRSSIPGNAYAAFNGTSMATPHVAGAVALMWSAAPSLVGDIAATRALLDQTAIDTPDTTCGGGAANNNVYGEGRLDAWAAVDFSPRGPTGILQGAVTDAVTGQPVPGMTVRAAGPAIRSTFTGPAGGYTFTLPVGVYDVAVEGFGYLPAAAAGLPVAESDTTVQDFALSPAPAHALSGLVTDPDGNPVALATVTIPGTPIPPAVTDDAGAYRFAAVPEGVYDVQATAGRCFDSRTQTVTLDADAILDFPLPPRADAFGYTCRIVPQTWVDAPDLLALSGDDAWVQVSLPFAFELYGGRYTTASIATNGFVTLGTPSQAYSNTAIPGVWEPNAAVYALWDDLYVDPNASVRAGTVGAAPDRRFVIEWRNVTFYGDTASRLDVEVMLAETGEVVAQYRNVTPGSGRAQGNSATLGLENASGTVAFQYSFNEAVLTADMSLRYAVTPFTGVEGVVTDDNDHLAIAGATVRALQDGSEVQRAAADTAGFYRFYLPAGDYVIEAGAAGYPARSAAVTVAAGSHVMQDFSLPTPRPEADPASFAFTLYVGQTRSQTLTLSNTGGLDLHWQLAESGGDVTWLQESPAGGTLAAAASQPIQITADTAGLSRGTYYATLVLQSDSGRRPSFTIAVSLSVSQYDQTVNAGGGGYYDPSYLYWYPDSTWSAGLWGYMNGASTTDSTKRAIAGTTSVPLYQTMRVNPGEYRFDGLAPGSYQVTIGFAEYRKVKRGARVFDVAAEGAILLPAHDLMTHSAIFTADTHVFTVAVTDGQLNLTFVARPGSLPPAVCALRVTQLS